MQQTYRWRVLAVLGPCATLLFAVTGAIAFVLGGFVERPEMLLFSREGRIESGQVYRSAPVDAANGGKRLNRSAVSVADPELGPQTIIVYGDLPVGQRVPVVCVTTASRCLSAEDVKQRLEIWPFTPLMLVGAIATILAAVSCVGGLSYAAARDD